MVSQNSKTKLKSAPNIELLFVFLWTLSLILCFPADLGKCFGVPASCQRAAGGGGLRYWCQCICLWNKHSRWGGVFCRVSVGFPFCMSFRDGGEEVVRGNLGCRVTGHVNREKNPKQMSLPFSLCTSLFASCLNTSRSRRGTFSILAWGLQHCNKYVFHWKNTDFILSSFAYCFGLEIINF